MTAGRCFTLFFLLALSLATQAQKSKTQLQREKQKSLEKIKETERILAETSQQKKNSLGELTALNQRIAQQEALIKSIQGEVSLLDYDISENNQIIDALARDLNKLKQEYTSMLFAAQKASGKIDKLTFLFSAQSFDQMLMRLKYMEQYGKARQDQAVAIQKVQGILKEQVRLTEIKRSEKNALLNEQVKENQQLTQLKQKQRTLVQSLEKQEKQLRKELEETRKAVAELDNLIAKIIKEEMERAAREARERDKTKTGRDLTEAAIALSASFEDNKQKFPWPVAGFVSQNFGRQAHPVLKGIIIQNDGINIQTRAGETVKSIFNGEVSAVSFTPGFGNTIIVRHGEYFTVYTGLKEILVKKGQQVTTNQNIGTIVVNSSGIPELRFQIRKNFDALDPQEWLRN
ncbi:MAG: peptidoglycan DD-metalloendopeptidase family protein [Cyclobacteriaceae bacterium]|nr:peptidoglycan DD-metalloendopeptidase family protein [Cytophagales bacterium]MBX2901141.1 peptidoglycan DD-metalloendopeptidase family protein [Cyclobacteriaceae bacterium]